MIKLKIGIFNFFIIFYILFNYLVITINSFDSILNYYVFSVTSLMLLIAYFLDKSEHFKINFEFLNNDILLKYLFAIYFLNITIFILINDNTFNEILNYKSLLIDKYYLRVNGIKVPFYWIFELLTKFGVALSIIYLIRKQTLMLILTVVLYFVFYAYSVQKSPIATLFIILIIIYLSYNKFSFVFALKVVVSLVIILAYFYFLIFDGFDFNNLTVMYQALLNRISVAGEIILFTYHYYDANELLNGATFPKLLGLIPLNIFEHESVRLPSIIMYERQGQEFGGANSSFITDGFSNFGYGFDIIFIVFLFLFICSMIYLSKIFIPFLSNFYKLSISILLIDLVHMQFWSFINKTIILFIFFALLNFIIKGYRYENSNINSTK